MRAKEFHDLFEFGSALKGSETECARMIERQFPLGLVIVTQTPISRNLGLTVEIFSFPGRDDREMNCSVYYIFNVSEDGTTGTGWTK